MTIRFGLFLDMLGMACLLAAPDPALAGKPCDDYPRPKQQRCEALWKQLNAEAEPEMAQFGLAQLKRRQEGKITPEQHLQENTDFIKRSTERRLKLLKDRLDKE